MKRRIALAAVLSLMLASQTFANAWLKSIGAAQKTAQQKKQLILVDMYADWCGWCKRFEKEVFPALVFQQATDDMVLLRLNTEDGGEGSQYARKYGVSSLPTFMVLAPDLSVAGVIKGYAPPNDFVNSLKQTRQRYDTFLQLVKKEPSFAKDYRARLDLAKQFTQRAAYDKSEARLKKLTAEKGVPAAIRDEAYYELALVYALQERGDDSLRTIRRLTSTSTKGESVQRARLLAGQIYMQQGNLLGAANEFRSFKADFPDSPLVRNVDMVLPEIERRLAASK